MWVVSKLLLLSRDCGLSLCRRTSSIPSSCMDGRVVDAQPGEHLSHNQVPDALMNRLCPRGLGISEDRDDDEPNSHISQTISIMFNFPRKQCPTADGTEMRPGSCTTSRYYPIRKLMAFRSKKATFRRCDEDGARHRKRVGRRLPASQILFGGYQRSHKAPRSTFPSNRATIWLIRSP